MHGVKIVLYAINAKHADLPVILRPYFDVYSCFAINIFFVYKAIDSVINISNNNYCCLKPLPHLLPCLETYLD